MLSVMLGSPCAGNNDETRFRSRWYRVHELREGPRAPRPSRTLRSCLETPEESMYTPCVYEFEPSLDASSLRSDVISPIKILSFLWRNTPGPGRP